MNTFFLNAKKCSTHQTALTGGQIKELGRANQSYHLCYENPHPDCTADKFWVWVGDGEAVRLDTDKPLHFFASPQATPMPGSRPNP